MWLGYGFVDFDAPGAADRAVTALQNRGIQAQMAKVGVLYHEFSTFSFKIIVVY